MFLKLQTSVILINSTDKHRICRGKVCWRCLGMHALYVYIALLKSSTCSISSRSWCQRALISIRKGKRNKGLKLQSFENNIKTSCQKIFMVHWNLQYSLKTNSCLSIPGSRPSFRISYFHFITNLRNNPQTPALQGSQKGKFHTLLWTTICRKQLCLQRLICWFQHCCGRHWGLQAQG